MRTPVWPSIRVAILLGLLAAPAGAQSIAVAVHGGVNMARVGAGAGADSSYAAKPVGGGSVAFNLFGQLNLRVELEYAQKGGELTVATAGGGMMQTDYTLGYLALPVNLRYDLGGFGSTAYLFAGTTVGALLSASQRAEGGASTDVKDELAPIDLTLDLGGGFGKQLSPRVALVCDVRFSLGLVQLADEDSLLATDSWKSRDIQVVLGLSYTFGAIAPQFQMPVMPAGMPVYPGYPGMPMPAPTMPPPPTSPPPTSP